MDLRQRWTTVAEESLKLPESVSRKWWEHIEQKYSKSQRHYYTLRHLEEMFQHFDQYQNVLIHPDLVSLAIFFMSKVCKHS
jgi:predicted metal-dependent HD superfamily phosphohydrolase